MDTVANIAEQRSRTGESYHVTLKNVPKSVLESDMDYPDQPVYHDQGPYCPLTDSVATIERIT